MVDGYTDLASVKAHDLPSKAQRIIGNKNIISRRLFADVVELGQRHLKLSRIEDLRGACNQRIDDGLNYENIAGGNVVYLSPLSFETLHVRSARNNILRVETYSTEIESLQIEHNCFVQSPTDPGR